MKTTNNISQVKSAMISMFMIISLLTVNLSAQQTYTQFSLMDEGRYIFLSARTNTLVVPVVPHVHIYTSAIEIPLEDWMLDPGSWSNETVMEKLPASFIEEKIEIESWMTTPDWMNVDEEIQIEKWMTSPKSWVSR